MIGNENRVAQCIIMYKIKSNILYFSSCWMVSSKPRDNVGLWPLTGSLHSIQAIPAIFLLFCLFILVFLPSHQPPNLKFSLVKNQTLNLRPWKQCRPILFQFQQSTRFFITSTKPFLEKKKSKILCLNMMVWILKCGSLICKTVQKAGFSQLIF